MGELDYPIEKFNAGALILATGLGNIHERLLDAYRSQVMRTDHPDDLRSLPPELRERVENLHARMTSAAATGDEGSIAATMATMTEDEAAKLAEEIWSIAYGLRTEQLERAVQRAKSR